MRLKSLLEIQRLDPEDRSLAEYKQALLGPPPPAQAPGPVVMDLTGDLAALKDQVFVLKEGVDYRGKITFKRPQVSAPHLPPGPAVDKTVYMVGSYGPSAQEYEFVTPVEEAPRGALVRGPYLVLSLFTEDDRTRHLSWEWGLRVCQDWKE
ncbi:hypothetical protein P7K49_013017 [Saguinus oedipus]|uniref:Rho GDP dissociation inhibitor gamma n=1 Tax=Saguinus oedipus TaxID=9490 RepID=A0ABQ9VEQ0_SAGOE|nr:hypothetical protein P7K49_013017 [Saguinus oedipus]